MHRDVHCVDIRPEEFAIPAVPYRNVTAMIVGFTDHASSANKDYSIHPYAAAYHTLTPFNASLKVVDAQHCLKYPQVRSNLQTECRPAVLLCSFVH